MELSADFYALCRWFCLLDNELNGEWKTKITWMAQLSWMHFHPRHRSPAPAQTEQVLALWHDARLATIPPRRRALGVVATVGALAQWMRRPEEARQQLRWILEMLSHTWVPSDPLAATQQHARVPIDWMPDTPDAVDPTGDPEPTLSTTVPEPAQPRTPHELAEPVHIAQILDGISTWEAVVQDVFDIPLGLMRLSGIPAGLQHHQHTELVEKTMVG